MLQVLAAQVSLMLESSNVLLSLAQDNDAVADTAADWARAVEAQRASQAHMQTLCALAERLSAASSVLQVRALQRLFGCFLAHNLAGQLPRHCGLQRALSCIHQRVVVAVAGVLHRPNHAAPAGALRGSSAVCRRLCQWRHVDARGGHRRRRSGIAFQESRGGEVAAADSLALCACTSS